MSNIEITKGDVLASQKREVILDPEKNIRITRGIPTESHRGITRAIFVPEKPHIFKVHQLHISDPSHPETVVTDVLVLLAHGIQTNNGWEFFGRQSIPETVKAYDAYAKRNNEDSLDFVLACNSNSKPNPLGIQVGDLGVRKDIAYAVGDTVQIRAGLPSSIDETGNVRLTASSKKDFFNLDHLLIKKAIKII